MLSFYQTQHLFYYGVDLHTTNMYLCVIDAEGAVKLHRNVKTKPEAFLKAIQPFRQDVVVGAECIFTWYWLADLCEENSIPFVLGHALYMKAIHFPTHIWCVPSTNRTVRPTPAAAARLATGT